ncbi:sulfite exporter TauE/SafE family protein [Hoeflea sp. G2-23]|uniref:Probable membrane transporter protein n=1 Tax=Hoeflea algicola TaxID=2983763 RepID=A0ABT3Z5C2_9HYPH|nr:sulfite exporter TauE/SafE family protein [Hoeflea algicola]MCY0146853.1 sulfite exporter TauE/SafE family protein [Hoeflea algicola]
MSPELLAWLLVGAAAGGFVNGLAGFGTALFALGFWLNIMPPQQAVAVVLITSILSGLQGVFVMRATIAANSRRLLQFLLPGLIGVPIGLTLLEYLEAGSLKLTIGIFMLFYGGFFIARQSLPVVDGPRAYTQMAIGFIGGILGGAASLSGALPTMWSALRPWNKAEQRAVLQPYNVIVLTVSAIILGVQGTYDRETLILIGIALPTTLLAAHVGLMVFHRMQDRHFSRLLIVMMFVSGCTILVGQLF